MTTRNDCGNQAWQRGTGLHDRHGEGGVPARSRRTWAPGRGSGRKSGRGPFPSLRETCDCIRNTLWTSTTTTGQREWIETKTVRATALGRLMVHAWASSCRGTAIVAPHLGHLIFFPAEAALVLRLLPHAPQENTTFSGVIGTT